MWDQFKNNVFLLVFDLEVSCNVFSSPSVIFWHSTNWIMQLHCCGQLMALKAHKH